MFIKFGFIKGRLLLLSIIPLVLASCSKSDIPSSVDKITQRWYSKEQVQIGENIFKQNCASCHGAEAQGQFNWRKPDERGVYPPPPLNGSGHSWHHPYPLLMKVIIDGGKAMPSWKNKLTEEEVTATIAYFQSHWPDEAYERWKKTHES